MMLAFKTVEYAQIGAALGTLFAALASWATVWLTRRVWVRNQQPRLRGSGRSARHGQLELTMTNSGLGFASEAGFLLRLKDGVARGRIGPGFVGTGDKHVIRIVGLTDVDAIVGLLYCLDSNDRWHVWKWDGSRHRTPRVGPFGRSPRELDAERQFSELYFGVLLDGAKLAIQREPFT